MIRKNSNLGVFVLSDSTIVIAETLDFSFDGLVVFDLITELFGFCNLSVVVFLPVLFLFSELI